jgi:hypothetical protein
MSIMSINYPALVHFNHFSSLFTHLRSTPVENVRQITPFYAKQTQLKPIQSQFKLNSNPIKAKTKPICRKGENERFCVDREPYDCFNNASRGIYHPKGCQFQTDYLLTNWQIGVEKIHAAQDWSRFT